jgi:hypothetical protein
MRAQGLTGSGGRYALASVHDWSLVGLQKSAFSDSDEVRFTVNLTHVSRVVWDRLVSSGRVRSARPSAGVLYGSEVEVVRLGTLLGEPFDKWWTVSPATDNEAVFSEVSAALFAVGLPWLRTRRDTPYFDRH